MVVSPGFDSCAVGLKAVTDAIDKCLSPEGEGCFIAHVWFQGHLDKEVERLYLEAGWSKVEINRANAGTVGSFVRLTE